MATLPVREIVLYKHGVGFFVREGEFNAPEVALTFRQDEINDVLKSLTAFDRAGGQVLGIHYQTPMDKAARLASTSIRLSTNLSLQDLLRDLRGRQVLITLESAPGSLETITGRVIGIDQGQPNNANKTADMAPLILLSILCEGDQVRVFPLDALRAIQIQDSQSSHDLSYFLDTSMSEDDRRTVTLHLSEGDHRLVVSYVAPSPTWRVSYRVVAESEEGQDSGKALLQGWGLFDNRLDEDLENVRVTLVAGQPISFIYDLYASRIPQRPTVQDEARIAPGPVEFRGSPRQQEAEDIPALKGLDAVRKRPGMYIGGSASINDGELPDWLVAERRAVPMRAGLYEGELSDYSAEDLRASTAVEIESEESGEFFQYRVTTPVSVKRGGSALVPILSTQVNYQRELLYNEEKLPDHPVAALRFANTTGLTLERGPVTVVENGDYRGEAIVAFTKDNNEIYLPYAVELGVLVTENTKSSRELAGLHISQGYWKSDEYLIQTTTYIIENTIAKPLTITIEAPIRDVWELFDSPVPDIENATERRWRVDAPKFGKAEFIRRERHRTGSYEELRDLKWKTLQRFLRDNVLDQATFDRLADMLKQIDSTKQMERLKGKLDTERDTLYKQQEQLRANLSALQSTGQEASLRKRMLDQLEATQNRLEEIEREIKQADLDIAAAEARVQEIIAALG